MGFFSKKAGRDAKETLPRQEAASDAVLSRQDIFTGLPSMDKWQAIRLTGEKLLQKGCVEEPYIDAMVERETVVTTYLGEGVAIPHGVGAARSFIKRTGLVVLQFPEGVEFETGLAHLLVGIAALEDEHMPLLASIADIMTQEEVLAPLLRSTDPNFIYDCFIKHMA